MYVILPTDKVTLISLIEGEKSRAGLIDNYTFSFCVSAPLTTKIKFK